MSLRILVIDDEDIVLISIVRVLTKLGGCSVSSTREGKQALELIRYEKFDLIICDVKMPGMNGFETCKSLREIPEHPPVMLITGALDLKTEVEIGNFAPQGILYKPFGATELLECVKKVLTRTSVIPV